MNNNLPAINNNNPLQKIEQKLLISNKLLVKTDDKWLVEFFIRHPELFINLVSSFYPLSETHLEKYEEDWDWDRIINNNNLILTEKSIDKFNHKLLWGNCISKNETLSWTLEFIEKYKEELDWNALSRNKAIPWSI